MRVKDLAGTNVMVLAPNETEANNDKDRQQRQQKHPQQSVGNEEEDDSFKPFLASSQTPRVLLFDQSNVNGAMIGGIAADDPAAIVDRTDNNIAATDLDQPAPDPGAEQQALEDSTGDQQTETINGYISDSNTLAADSDAAIERQLLKPTGTHIRYQFSAGPTKCFCRVYFTEQFDALRRVSNCEVDFIQSLARCQRWNARGGQSGSSFFKSQDGRFIMKQLSKPEMESFLRSAPAYFEYMSQSLFHDLPTVLARLFGVYRLGFKNTQTGRSMKMDVLVMENVFYGRQTSRIFDLKGSVRNRHVQASSEVLLDENFLELIAESPLFIREHSKKLLRAAVWNDTLFLSKLDVMDYSLLVGVDDKQGELVVGIVDFVRTFTWDKKLESWVKETGILGGGGHEPTIVSPKQYKTRFRNSMEQYFLMVPDKYCDPKSIRRPPRIAASQPSAKVRPVNRGKL